MKSNRFVVALAIAVAGGLAGYWRLASLAQAPPAPLVSERPALSVVDSDPVRSRSDPEFNEWYHLMHRGFDALTHGDFSTALASYDFALAKSESDYLRADVYLYQAKVYEGMRRRSVAIATYLQLADQFPDSAHLPYVCFRLGELHTSITLLPSGASADERAAVSREMAPAMGIPWFEIGARAGAPTDPWSLSCRSYLADLYKRTGRKDEAWRMAYELASLNLHDVKSPSYAGPYARTSKAERTWNQLLDDARVHAAGVKKAAQRRLTTWSVSQDSLDQ
jgi:tetratricopeptide (TPR) repeat protein